MLNQNQIPPEQQNPAPAPPTEEPAPMTAQPEMYGQPKKPNAGMLVLVAVSAVLLISTALLSYLYFFSGDKDNPVETGKIAKSGTETVSVQTDAVTQADTADNELWRELYAAELRKYIGVGDEYNEPKFNIFDIDDDGIPELMFNLEYWRGATATMYTIYNGSLKLLTDDFGTYGGGFYYDPTNRYIIYIDGHMGIACAKIYKIENGEMNEIVEISVESQYNSDLAREVTKFYINGEEVSQEEYCSEAAKYDITIDSESHYYPSYEIGEWVIGEYPITESEINRVLFGGTSNGDNTETPPTDETKISTPEDLTWIAEPTFLYDNVWICTCGTFYCILDGENTKVGVDEKTGMLKYDSDCGHGAGFTDWVYDPDRDLFGFVDSSEGWSEIVLYPKNEAFAKIASLEYHPYITDRIMAVHSVDSSMRTNSSDDYEYFPEEAYHGKIAVAYNGEFVTEFIFDDIVTEKYVNDFKTLSKDGMYGIVDKNGNYIIPFILEHICIIDEYTAFAKHNGKYGIIKISGD